MLSRSAARVRARRLATTEAAGKPAVAFDLERARRDTPGCARVAHLNNAGAALPPTPVTEAVLGHLALEAEIGGYEAAARACDAIDHVYEAAARLPARRGGDRRERHARVGHGLLLAALREGGPHPHRQGGVREQLHRVPPGGAAHWRGGRGHPRR